MKYLSAKGTNIGEPLRAVKLMQPFTLKNALLLSVPLGGILTCIILIGNLNVTTWTISPKFHVILTLLCNCLLFFVLFLYVFSIIKRPFSAVKRYVLISVGALAIAVTFPLLSYLLQWFIYRDFLLSEWFSLNAIKDSAIALTAILATLFIYNLSRQHQILIENEHLQTENLLIRYETLLGQIDPHFLFNSLNTLSGLIEPGNERAQQYLQQMATIYRYIMQQNKLVHLSDEIAFSETYIEMMKIRYGACLSFNINIPKHLLSYYVVPISLQLLVENVLKHNIVSDRHPMNVTIDTTDTGEGFRLRVINPKQTKIGETQSSGIGLANLEKRYQLLFRKRISASETETHFTVTIPLIAPDKAKETIAKLLQTEQQEVNPANEPLS